MIHSIMVFGGFSNLADQRRFDLVAPGIFAIGVEMTYIAMRTELKVTHLVLDSSGNPHIGYGLKYTSWTGNLWVAQNVEQEGTRLGVGSLALDKWGNPHISSFDLYNKLYYAVGSWPGGFAFIPDSNTCKVELGGRATHTRILGNTSSVRDTSHLTYSSSQNWSTLVGSVLNGTVALPGSLTLAPGQTAIVTVTVSAPHGSAFVGVQGTTLVTATSSISPTLVRHVTDTTFVPLMQVYVPAVMFLFSTFPASQ